MSPSSLPVADATPTSSIGHAIQQSQKNPSALLTIATTQLWNVNDTNLPIHYLRQAIHHERRQRWSAQWLEAWSECCHDYNDDNLSLALERAITGAAVPITLLHSANNTSNEQQQHEPPPHDRVEKEGQWIHQALVALHRCVMNSAIPPSLLTPASQQGILQLIQRANALAKEYPLAMAVTTRWAIRGLLAATTITEMTTDKIIPDLDTRVAELPFDILPQNVNWQKLLPADDDAVSCLRSHLPFSTDTFTTRSGDIVHERRATAWCTTCPTIGALAYSGKLMPPQPLDKAIFEPILQAVQDCIGLLRNGNPSSSLFFDAVLCNDYQDSTAACAFHTDPEHGTVWDPTTCVVAAGAPRRFAFRGGLLLSPAAIDLYEGDVVHMWGNCNDMYEHAVYKGQQQEQNEGRVSLVLKRALDRGGGRKGHGLQGQGRRRQKNQKLGEVKKGSVASPGARKRTRRSKRKK